MSDSPEPGGEAPLERPEWFWKLLDALPVPLLVCQQWREGVFINRKFTELFGYTLNDIPTVAEWWPLAYPDPAYRAAFQARWNAALETARHESSPIEPLGSLVVCKDGAVKEIGFHYTSVGEYGLAVFDDRTGQKAAERALASSEARIRAVFEQAADAIWLVDPATGGFLEFNAAAHESLGYTRDEFARLTIAGVEASESPDEVARHIRKVIEEGTDEFETKHRTKGGELRDIHVSAKSISIGDKAYLQTILRDISQRKSSEKALADSAKDYRTVADFTYDWESWIMPDGRYRYVSPSCERVTGYPRERFMADSRMIFTIIHPDDRELYTSHVGHTHNPRCPVERIKFRIITADGAERWIEHVCQSVFDGEGNWLGRRASNRDITETVAAEEAMRRAREQAEEATRLKDKFVSLVAHDLRSPLTSILGLLKLLHGDMEGRCSADQKKAFAAVVQSGEHMLRLIDDLLNLGRLKSGKLAPEKVFTDAAAISARAIDMVSLQATRKGVAIHNETPPMLRVHADPALMGEVLQNLLTNAIKFSRAGDTVTLGAAAAKGQVTFAVRDQGPGVDERFIGHLFSIDVKTTAPGSAGEKGTGLGLPYSYEIMKSHGGDMTLITKKGEGSVFYAHLPERRPVAVVADDDQASRALLRMKLDEIGVDCIEADDGAEALAALEERKVDLLITDLGMPRLDGFGLIAAARARPVLAKLPIIAITITGAGSLEAHERVFQLGANDFVNKSLIEADFIPRVRRVIG